MTPNSVQAGRSSSEAQPAVAIVGGGITGLTAAFKLSQRGIGVTLYEAGSRVGGVIQSIRKDGFLAEFGPNSILETSPAITALIREAGLDGRRLYSDPAAENRYIVRWGKPQAMPMSPPGFFACRLFTGGAKLALLREPFIRRCPPGREESVAEFVLRRLGREFLDYAINPLIAGIYAGDPARLSVLHGFPKLYALEQRYGSLILGQILGARERKRRGEVSKQEAKKVSFDEGLQVLPETLAEKLGGAVRLRTSVTAAARGPAGWSVTARDESGKETTLPHSAVLLAAPTHQLARLQIRVDGVALPIATLASVYYPPVASVVLGFRRAEVAHALDGFGMLVPQAEGFRILGTLFSSSLFPNRAPAGHVTLTSYVGGVRAPELASKSGDELVAITTEDLRAILGIAGKPTFENFVFYPKAIPQYEVGYGKFKDLMTGLETRAPGLFFAGHYRDGISLGDSIVSACKIAERIARHCGADATRPEWDAGGR